jgi:hypothetical protein
MSQTSATYTKRERQIGRPMEGGRMELREREGERERERD